MTQDNQRIECSGACSIAHIDTCYREIVAKVNGQGPISIDLSRAESADISFVQLIVAAARKAEAQSRPFAVINMPSPVAASFRGAGVDVERLTRANLNS